VAGSSCRDFPTDIFNEGGGSSLDLSRTPAIADLMKTLTICVGAKQVCHDASHQ
jgi:hypothetical protein